jgi:hypothetical protein
LILDTKKLISQARIVKFQNSFSHGILTNSTTFLLQNYLYLVTRKKYFFKFLNYLKILAFLP